MTGNLSKTLQRTLADNSADLQYAGFEAVTCSNQGSSKDSSKKKYKKTTTTDTNKITNVAYTVHTIDATQLRNVPELKFSLFFLIGEHCELNASSGRCIPGVCKNGGKCVNRLAGGFMCQCPSGEYEKPYCEMTTRSFPGQSFITFRGLRQRFHFTVSFT